jgi:hypothetical protein
MIKLTSRFTVPQVFVNDHYIGGADDFKKFTGIFPENRKEQPKGDMSWFEEPAKVEETKLRPVQESERVVELPTPPFLDKTDYVSLIKADRGSANDAKTPSVLNCLVSYKDRVDPNPIAVVHRLKKQLDKIIEKHRDDKQAVDYQAIKELDEFLEFEVATAELQSVKLADMDDGVKKVRIVGKRGVRTQGLTTFYTLVTNPHDALNKHTCNFTFASFVLHLPPPLPRLIL